jgi:hypothetical protein
VAQRWIRDARLELRTELDRLRRQGLRIRHPHPTVVTIWAARRRWLHARLRDLGEGEPKAGCPRGARGMIDESHRANLIQARRAR